MRRLVISETFDLSADEIDLFSEWLREELTALRIERKDCLRASLLLEGLLLRMREHLKETTAVTANIEPRPGRTQIRLELSGEPFNPMNQTSEALGDWNSSLMTAIGLYPKYSYGFGKNTLRLHLPNRRLNAAAKILPAIMIGILTGVAGLFLLPESFRVSVSETFLDTGFDLWSRLLSAISGPIVFFMAVTSILNTKGISKQGGSVISVIGRFFLSTSLITVFTFFCTRPAFSFAAPAENAAQSFLSQGKQFLYNLIPHNIAEPFFDADTPQLFLLAILSGGALLSLGEHADVLRNAVRQINMLGMLVAKWVSYLVPISASVFLCLMIWRRQIRSLLGMWLPLALAFAVSLLVLTAAPLLLSFRTKVPFRSLLQRLRDPFLLTLKAGELDDNAYEAAERSCIRRLGIDSNFIKTYLPQGLVLYMPISTVGALVFTMYTMGVYQVPVDIFRQFTAALFAVLLFVVTPPVPGQNLLSYAVIFSWLGIPETAIIDAMFFEILFGIFSNAANLTLLQVETVFHAKRLGMLDADVYMRG